MQGVGFIVVFLHPFFEVADHAVHVAFHGKAFVGDVELLGAHQPQFVEVGDVDDDVGFTRGVLRAFPRGVTHARQFAQESGALGGFGDEGVGKALEVALFFSRGRGAPELVFVVADRVAVGEPGRGEDEGFVQVGAEQGVARGQQFDLARGVPPGQDACILPCVFVDGDSQRGQFGEFVVDGDDQFAAAVFPAEQDGRGRAAPGGGGQGDGVVHAFYPDFILGDGEVGQGASPRASNWATPPSLTRV